MKDITIIKNGRGETLIELFVSPLAAEINLQTGEVHISAFNEEGDEFLMDSEVLPDYYDPEPFLVLTFEDLVYLYGQMTQWEPTEPDYAEKAQEKLEYEMDMARYE